MPFITKGLSFVKKIMFAKVRCKSLKVKHHKTEHDLGVVKENNPGVEGLVCNHLCHLACINHHIPHGESSNENCRRDDSRDPGIMFSEFNMLDVMRDQFVHLECQGQKDAHAHHERPEHQGEPATHS